LATVEYVPVEEMLPKRALRRESPRRQVRAEYEDYISRLGSDQAGKITIGEGERVSTIRDRLRRAAKRLDRDVQIRRKGSVLYFRLGQNS
jgi:hypothetical protein